ncbi:MAG: hypothetical protein VX736_01225, partial [Candidatus Neomarinimicrobiota bacterium]|nr:hypothetical protein [Candidatus Neomarinimicrobiota bacterium]
MAVSNPEQDSAYYFERSTQNTIRIGDPQVISTGNNILVVDIDPSYSDTLMPIKFIEDSQVGAITEANDLVLKLPESSALIWDQDNFDEIIMGEAVQQVMIDSNGNLKLDLGNDLSAGDTLIIRRLPVKNIVSHSYNQNLQCSTNGSNFNRNDPQTLSIGTAEIFSDDINFLLNDTSQTIPILLVQDPEVNLIRSQYGLYLFIDDAFPVVFDTSQHNLSYNYSNQDFSDSIRHISNKKIQLMLSNEIAPSDTLSLAQLRFSGFSTRFFNNNLISLSVKDENHSSFTDSTYKGIGKPEFESDPRLVLSGSETSIIMPSIQVWDDNQVGVINSGRKISFILSDDYNVNWQQIPLLDISGAYDKVNPVPIFSEDQKRLSIQIMEDFSVEDSIIVNGLRVQAVGYGAGDLFLSINESTYQDTILNWIRSGDVSFNSSDQIFLKNVDLDQRILSTIKIGQGETAIIDSVFDLILRLPLDSYMTWHAQQDPSYTFHEDEGGSISSNVGISENGKSLTLPVDYFPTGDTLYIDSLYFGEFTSTDSIHLYLGLDGENNAMVLEDTAFKIVAGFELDFERDWNFVQGDSGVFSMLPNINVVNDNYNTLKKTDVYLNLPDTRLAWDIDLQSISILQDTIIIGTHDINRINDTLLHIPSGLPVSEGDSLSFSGLMLGTMLDTLSPKNPNFIFSLTNELESGVNNSIDVQSSKAFGIGRPTITYVENYSIALDEDIIKPLPDISVTELNAPIFGPHRDLILLPVIDGTDMIRFNLIDNLDVSDPGFIRSVKGDTVIIGFTRNTLGHETIYLSNLSISIEPFYSTGLYQDTGLLSGSMINTMGISYKVGEDYSSTLISEGPEIEFYPSLLFTEPEFFVHNNILQLSVFIFPSMIDHENTAFTSAIQFNHIDLGGQFLNNLSGQFENISYLINQHYSLSSDLQIILDKMIITFNASISDTLNKYSDLNRYYP